MLQSLDHYARLVALEAKPTADVLGVVGAVFDDVHSAFSNFIDRFSPSEPGLPLAGNQQSFLKEVNQHAYVGIRSVTAYTPEGLNVTYMAYLDALAPAVEHVSLMPHHVLFPFSKFLAGLVTNRELASTGGRSELNLEKLAQQRQQLNQQLGKCFLAGSHRTDRTVGDVLARNVDWEDVFRRTDALSTAINRIDRKVLDKKVKECVELLSAIQRKIQRKEFGDMSSTVANTLANGTFQVASELEFYSVVFYRLQALLTAVNRTAAHLKFVFDK